MIRTHKDLDVWKKAIAAELETQLIISRNLSYIKENEIGNLIEELNSISRMIQGLIKSIA